MRLRLTVLSLMMCGVLASEVPAQGTTRGGGRMFGGGGAGRGFSAPRAAAPSASSASRSFFGSRGGTSVPRSSGTSQWRSNAFSGGRAASAASSTYRSGSSFGSRAAPRASSGQSANWTRFGASRGATQGTSSSARSAGRSGFSSSDSLSPFARGLSSSSTGSRYFGQSRGSRGTSPSAAGSRSSSGSQFFGRGTGGTGRTGQSATGGQSTQRPSARGTSRSPGADQVPADAAGRRAGQTGFVRPSSAGATEARGRIPSGRSTGSGAVPDYGYRRYGYYPRPYSSYPNCYPYGYGYYGYPYYSSPYYCGSGFYLGFTFGVGAYFGLSYYYPWYHCGYNYAFFYGSPLSYCYVPYGFYCDAPATYVTRYVYVEDTYPTTEYESVEVKPPEGEPTEEQKVVEPEPAAGSPVAEKYLRDASELFRKGDYLEAAKLFRLAALSVPENAAPLFALGQSLIAIGSDAYAAKVIRKAVLMNPGLVKEPGDIVGVYKDQAEFDRVMGELVKRAEQSPEGSDARFLLAVERYFTGDPKAVEGFAALRAALPDDKAVELFDTAATKRFAAAEDLPDVAPPAPK